MRSFRPMIVPQGVHPLVRKLFERMNHEQIGILDLSERSGVNKNTINDWKRRSMPTLANIDACYAVLGLRLSVNKMDVDNTATK